ncbi:UNVERIFIED_CONTAM: acyl-ACP--UDP-N-acetylglucosamine O-acyltransferase [Prevotella sp. 15_C9]
MNKISPMAFIHPNAQLGENNIIGPFCYIDDNTILGDNNILQNSVTINYGARIGDGNEFFPGASISTKPQDLKFQGEDTICEIGNHNSIRENVTISRGTASKGTTIVGDYNLFMENMHIAHDCIIGSHIIVGNSTKFAGEVTIDDFAVISAAVLCHQFCKIGRNVMIQGGSRFSQDIPPYILAGRDPIRYTGINIIGLRRRGFSKEQIDQIHNTYRILYSEGTRAENMQKIKDTMELTQEVKNIIDFVETSERGIIK